VLSSLPPKSTGRGNPSRLDLPQRRRKHKAHCDVLHLLNLRMGIVDMKLTDDGQPMWLELNPQGQFLFLEGLCDMQLPRRFGDFVVNEARRNRPDDATPGQAM
jgi:hypothetical protein